MPKIKTREVRGDIYANYPKPEDWENRRFSDEAYAGCSPKGPKRPYR